MNPYIAEIKGHSLDDGPGIRSVIFFKGCPLSCVWCHNPESINPKPEIMYDEDRCQNFGNCLSVCFARLEAGSEARSASGPDQCGETIANFTKINPDQCDACGRCVEHCDSGALSIVGQSLSIDDILQTIEPYQTFYDNSGGGVTLSGGEATLYPQFCEPLLRRLKSRNIHVLLETAGLYNPDRFFRQFYPYLDQIYFDLKLIDSDQHKRYCGVDNRRILQNFAALVKKENQGGVEVLPRIPLIPEITATEGNLKSIAAFLQSLGVAQVALLPYNPAWKSKASQLGRYSSPLPDSWMSASEIVRCHRYFDGFNIVNSQDPS